jgi:membrane protein EpsK
MSKSRLAPSRLTVNLIANGFGFALHVVVGMLLTPYLARRLGVEGYGLTSLVMTLAGWLMLASIAANAAVGRFITYAVTRGDLEGANRFFNSSLVAAGGCALLVLGVSFAASSWVVRLARIPAGQEGAAQALFLLTVASAAFTTLAVPFQVSTFCTNRLDVRNAVSALGTATRVGVILGLFASLGPSIAAVGVAALAAAAVQLAGGVVTWKRLTPGLEIRLRDFSLRALAEVSSATGWMVVNQVGALLLLSVDLWVVNRLYGPEKTGLYALVLPWAGLMRGVASALNGALIPTMTARYAALDHAALARYSSGAVKLLGLTLALPIGLVAGLAAPILHVWLGPRFVELSGLLALMVAPLALTLATAPLFSLSHAANRVRDPGIAQLVAGVANVAFAFLFASGLGLEMYGVALAGVTVLTMKNVVFVRWYVARIAGPAACGTWGELARVAGAVAAVAGCSWLSARAVDLRSPVRLAAFCVALALVYAATAWRLLFNAADRELVARHVPLARVASRLGLTPRAPTTTVK